VVSFHIAAEANIIFRDPDVCQLLVVYVSQAIAGDLLFAPVDSIVAVIMRQRVTRRD
jgi:hypothetical protein